MKRDPFKGMIFEDDEDNPMYGGQPRQQNPRMFDASGKPKPEVMDWMNRTSGPNAGFRPC